MKGLAKRSRKSAIFWARTSSWSGPAAGQVRRLIGDDADRAPVHAREPDHEVPREVLVHFEELAVIDYAVDDVLDIVRQVRFGRHERIEIGIHTVDRIGAGAAWRLVA